MRELSYRNSRPTDRVLIVLLAVSGVSASPSTALEPGGAGYHGPTGGLRPNAVIDESGPRRPCPIEPPDPLYPESTPREPDVIYETTDALVTRFADRARDRHAREDIVNGLEFRKYDHWLPFYWEQRVADIEIQDFAAKGGVGVRFNFVTHARLNPAEFRSFYANASAVSAYLNNMSDLPNMGVSLVSQQPSTTYPGETEFHYTGTILRKWPEQTMLQPGDRIEVELSQFLLDPRNGRNNYYGTAFLYVVGQGVVPWYAKAKEESATPEEFASASFDSFPLPANAWLGGRTTLPYQYSNEPLHRFKQMAGNISSESGRSFMLGRRLHHTDFRTGAHSEPDNPPLTEHSGQLGPRFTNTSCVSCHVNNGRALPPPVGNAVLQGIVRVGADAAGSPHPTLGEDLQPSAGQLPEIDVRIEAEAASALGGVINEPCADTGGGIDLTLVDANDWMNYGNDPVTVPRSGRYRVEFRVANHAGDGVISFEEMGGTINYGSVGVGPTGGPQSWVSAPIFVTLSAGQHRFGVKALAGGWNFNWLRVVGPFDPTTDAEGAAILANWEALPGNYGDGTRYVLRRPVYSFTTGPAPVFHSVRLAPALVGLGLLEAVDEATVLALADECDLNGDGISGRAAIVADPRVPGARRLGRFGYKATQPSVRHQIAYALNRDMGVANSVFPMLDNDTTPSAPELTDVELDRLTRYVSLLGVPARRNLTDARALRGEQLFVQANCAACHVPVMRTGTHHPFGELRDQIIHPYTDLLLHDMGPGLADSMADHGAAGSEWRTPPLWGIGLTTGVSGGEAYLHDGRAGSLEEAILWHGGEASAAKESFRQLSATDRAALLQFLRSL